MHHPIKQTIHVGHSSKCSNALIYFFATATPLFMVPQAIEILKSRSSENVALLTWVFFLVADIV